MNSEKGGDIGLHPAAAVVAAGAKGLPAGWACLGASGLVWSQWCKFGASGVSLEPLDPMR